eukprot:TCALIF_03172-PA protein Name:"Similar to nlg-1 Neuroligin-1 (Caenorhabditis elegans)" AED:0.14 eAED:0.14 QI:0/0.92/0.71/0.92/1/1/14/10/968
MNSGYASAVDESLEDGYPVLVFIHGESFSWGSGNLYDGRVLASYGNTIVVTFNFRLGVFGFLNTNVNPGRKPRMANYGMMDQIAALKWIQENIAQFGGNPNAITLFGHQTGAAAIHFLMNSPAVVPGLFHRVIMMSGSAFSSWALVDDPVHYAVKLAAALNCSIPRNMLHEHEDILTCLRQKSMEELTTFDFGAPSFLTAMGPSKDGILIPNDFGTDNLLQKNKRANRVTYEVILGLVEDESDTYFSELEASQGIGPSTRDQYLRTLIRNNYDFHLNEIFATVQNEYSDWMSSDLTGGQIRPHYLQWEAAKAITDRLYTAPIIQSANWCNQSGFPVYFYIFGRLNDDEEDLILALNSPRKSTPRWQSVDDIASIDLDPSPASGDKSSLDRSSSSTSFSSSSGSSSSVSSGDIGGKTHLLSRRSRSGSMLPMVFGLPFAPELQDQQSSIWALRDTVGQSPGQQGTTSQMLLTLWTNFANSGDPNRPFNVQSLFPHFQDGWNAKSSEGRPGRIWPQYDMKQQKYLKIDSSPKVDHHFRLHEMSIWLHLVPKLHQAGSNNIFPQHNAFMGHDDPSLFKGVVRPHSFSHGYQVNRKFFDATTSPSPPITTCLPVNSRGQIISSEQDLSLVRWEKASEHAYKQAMYLTIGLGTLLFGVNIWFLLCLFFCRSRISCCAHLEDSNRVSGMGNKDFTCETELMGLTNDSMQSLRDSGGGSNPTHKSRSNANSRNNSLNRAHLNNVHESMRLLQSSSLVESDRDSRSTSSQSHCGGGVAPNSKSISFTMSSAGGGVGGGSETRRNSREKSFESAGLQHNHPVVSSGHSHQHPHIKSMASTLPPPQKYRQGGGHTCSNANELVVTATLGRKLRPVNCQMHEESSLRESLNSPNGSSTASSQGVSILLPPPKDSILHAPPPSSSSLKRYPSSQPPHHIGCDQKPTKMTTFALPLDHTDSSSECAISPPVVSFGGETILQ